MKGQEYIDELAGVVALPDHMPGSLMDFARRIRVYIGVESQKVAPDNGLIALLADAARLGWEQIAWMDAPLNVVERADTAPNRHKPSASQITS
jgi:hypothetical protein